MNENPRTLLPANSVMKKPSSMRILMTGLFLIVFFSSLITFLILVIFGDVDIIAGILAGLFSGGFFLARMFMKR